MKRINFAKKVHVFLIERLRAGDMDYYQGKRLCSNES